MCIGCDCKSFLAGQPHDYDNIMTIRRKQPANWLIDWKIDFIVMLGADPKPQGLARIQRKMG